MITKPVVLLAAVGFLLPVLPAAAQATGCPVGSSNYHQARTGGCGYGRWSRGVGRLRQPWFKLSGTVRDTKADGSCGRVEVHTRVAWTRDSTRSFRVCGNGNRAAVNFSDTDTASGGAGSVQAWSVRLCVADSCTPYVDYKPA